VRALAGELAVEAVCGLEPDLLAGRNLGDRLQVGVPAVVHQSSSRTRPAASRHAAASSSLQARGSPSTCSETIASRLPSTKIGVTTCAARPPYASSIRW